MHYIRKRQRGGRGEESPEATGRDTGTQERSETPAAEDRRREKGERQGRKEPGAQREGGEEGGAALEAPQARAGIFPMQGHGEPLLEHHGTGGVSLELAVRSLQALTWVCVLQ